MKGPKLTVSPAAGPSGIYPFVTLSGVDGTAREYALSFCVSDNECTDVGTLTSGISKRIGPIKAAQLGAYRFKVKLAEPDSEVTAGFRVVEFAIGTSTKDAPLPATFNLGPARALGRPGSCPPYALPDGRILIGTSAFDPQSATTVDLEVNPAELTWSPDGKQLAMIVADRKEIRVAKPDGSNATTVVREPRAFLSSISFSQDGDKLAFIARPDPAIRGGPRQPTVQILNLADNAVGNGGPGVAVALSSTSPAMAIQSGSEIFIADISTPANRALLATGERPVFSSDGKIVTYVRAEEAFARRLDSSPETPLNLKGVCGAVITPTGIFATGQSDKTVSQHPFAR